jgi:virginiamycin B lyase
MRNRSWLLLMVPALVVSPVAAQEMNPVELTEWEVPWENTRPRDPYVLDTTQVWFVGQTGDYAAVLNSATGDFEKFDLEEGAGPHNLIVAEDGFVWYSGNRAYHIGKLDPRSGEIAKFRTESRDPHTLVFDHNGDIWFTAQQSNRIGKLTMADERVVELDLATDRSRPYAIKIDSHNRPWIALFGTNKIATVNEDMTIREIVLPHEDSRPRRLEITSDDRIWWTDYSRGFIGVYDPQNETFREWALPTGGESRPYGSAVDDNDVIWLVEAGARPNQFVGFDTKTEEIISVTKIASGGGTVRHMMYHEPTRTVWFGTDTNYVGRARVP